jgi:threonyl-tRNA synthetase
MCMNDGHVYCAAEQVETELHAVLDMYAEVYALLAIDGVRFRLSLRDAVDARNKYAADESSWRWAEALLRRVLEQRGVAYEEGVGHAAFYGPKIDLQVRTIGGADETLSTVQLDFVQSARLGLRYTAASGEPAIPFCIHRAPLSTHERMVAFLVERYGGAFPTWLAPTQLLVVPVADSYGPYAETLVRRFRARFIRAELAAAGESVARNVRDAIERKVPNIAVVGRREQADGTATVRRRGSETQLTFSVEELERRLLGTIAARLPALDVTEYPPPPP